MGEAKLRGSFEVRLAQAIAGGRIKKKFRNASGGYFSTDGHRNSGIYTRKKGGYTKPKRGK